ncbi:MAG: tripartite tricarboxylate transporter substrate binding protein [Betaproteobacteria bacterium]|nr:tripartite tricarboxylate transporter substrate binding protein [Betaproteobacteria bacterium]
MPRQRHDEGGPRINVPHAQLRRKLLWQTGALIGAGAMGFALAPAPSALAQGTWPGGKPIRLISPFPPGGTTDQLARLVAQPLSQALGTQVLVENRPGGNGSIGTQAAAKAPPDGLTFVFVFDTHGTNPSLIPNMPFDTRNDLAPVMLIATGAMVIVAHKSQPERSFADLVKTAKSSPGGVNYGTIGSGSLAQLAMTSLSAQLRFPMQHIPYKGGGPLVQDAIAGHVPMAMATTALFSPHIKSGTLFPLAVTSARRDPVIPEVPTIAEQGLPGFEASAWWGVFAPAKTPSEIVGRMNKELARIFADPAVKERLTNQGMNLTSSPPEFLGKFLDEQISRWAKVIKEHGITAGS